MRVPVFHILNIKRLLTMVFYQKNTVFHRWIGVSIRDVGMDGFIAQMRKVLSDCVFGTLSRV